MKLQCYSVRDAAVGSFLQPFYCRSKGEAIRSFGDAVSTDNHQFSKHASDFTLFFVGVFSEESGAFEPCEPERVISAIEVQALMTRDPT